MNEQPPPLAATLADRYRIDGELGAGGMATVYLAHDLRHDRRVALKVLRPELAAVVGAERFLAEIRTTANLQHPHILPLFDSGEDGGLVWYTMPHVEGESLRDRLDREKQLPVEQAVAIAGKVAGALQAAHDRGIVHRDVKPANILLDTRGEPLVSDFGIALAVQEAGGGRLTETGLSLGTPHYMSPEQATADRDVDPRSDVYSLACVLYEMLAGEPPFSGSTAQAVLARILTEEPRLLTNVRKAVPANVEAAVRKGLEKLPADRFPDAESFAGALADPSFVHVTGGTSGARARTGATGGAGGTAVRRRLHAALTLALALAAVVLWVTRPTARPAGDPAPPLSFVVAELSGGGGFGQAEMGSDGTLAWTENGRIYVRLPGALEGQPILDAETVVRAMALAPDGGRVAWLGRDGRPWTTVLETGVSTPIWEPEVEGVASSVRWTESERVTIVAVLPEGGGQRVVQVPPRGGVVDEVWRVEFSGGRISSAAVLPDEGGLLLNLVEVEPFVPSIVVLDPASGDTTLVAAYAGSPVWSPTGHIVYAAADGRIWAVPWDLDRRRAAAPAIVVGSDAATAPRVALGAGGTMVYVRGLALGVAGITERIGSGGDGGTRYHFNLVAPSGAADGLGLEPSNAMDAELSPDGRLLAYRRDDGVRIFDRDRGTDRLLARGEGVAWSPAGDSVAYWDEEGRIAIRAADGTGAPRVLRQAPDSAYPSQWLPGGDLLVWDGNGAGAGDVWRVDLMDADPPELILGGRWREVDARVSPDGRWLSYISDREGDAAVYRRSWPDLMNEVRLSAEGEMAPAWGQPIWSPDARRLYYSVEPRSGGGIRWVDLDDDGRPLEASRGTWFAGAATLRPEGMTPDGRLLVTSEGWALSDYGGRREQLIVVTGWTSMLRNGTPEAGSGP
ncbi:MAG TPA: protein kinase [Longimicrobiales bacterium]|nr:protein kinase [Longimicrobiales bacterium]